MDSSGGVAGNGYGALAGVPVRRKSRKKTVDRRASKGRKIKYVTHPKMQNFMFPQVRCWTWFILLFSAQNPHARASDCEWKVCRDGWVTFFFFRVYGVAKRQDIRNFFGATGSLLAREYARNARMRKPWINLFIYFAVLARIFVALGNSSSCETLSPCLVDMNVLAGISWTRLLLQSVTFLVC